MTTIHDDDRQQAEARFHAYNSFLKQSHLDPMGEAFADGWKAAFEYIGRLIQTPGGDGCYCAHHPDDPAHTKDCYDLMKALTGR